MLVLRTLLSLLFTTIFCSPLNFLLFLLFTTKFSSVLQFQNHIELFSAFFDESRESQL